MYVFVFNRISLVFNSKVSLSCESYEILLYKLRTCQTVPIERTSYMSDLCRTSRKFMSHQERTKKDLLRLYTLDRCDQVKSPHINPLLTLVMTKAVAQTY